MLQSITGRQLPYEVIQKLLHQVVMIIVHVHRDREEGRHNYRNFYADPLTRESAHERYFKRKSYSAFFACVVLLVLFYWAASFYLHADLRAAGWNVSSMDDYSILGNVPRGKTIYKWLRLAVNFASFSLAPACRTCRSDCFDKDKRALHRGSRFATMAEVKKAGLVIRKKGLDKTILVGKFKDRYLTLRRISVCSFWLRLPVQVKVLELWYQTVLTIPTLWLCC